jgi:hypothetical protein
MKNYTAVTKGFMLLFLSFLFINAGKTQQPGLPKDATRTKQLPVQPKPLIKKDSVSYQVVPVGVRASATLATADELYIGQGSFLLRTVRDYRYLTIKDDYNKSSIVYRYADWDLPNQFWNFVQKPGGYYKIRSGSGLFLEMGGRGTYYVVSKAESNTDNQLWQLETTDNGNFYIRSKSGQYLGVYMSQVGDGTVAGLSNARDNSAFQKWQLVKMSNDRRKTTSFNPERNGFHFINTFNGEDFIRWGGLCGGMIYTALDYIRTGIPIPTQSYTPANATPLQSYIYQRQQHSMWNVNEKWSELEVAYNTRGGEIFRWGIQGYGGGRLEELKNAIDGNRSVPLGLFVGGVRGIDNDGNGNHVVLAVGYAMGRYTGNLEGHPEDFRIFIYNPNRRNQTTTLVPNMDGQCYFEVESGKVWRTYFVNNKYDNDHTPPADIPNFPEREPDGSIRHLYFTFRTGGDDLRGKNDNVHITVHYNDGSSQTFLNVNGLARWVDNSDNTIHIELNRAVRKTDISHFTLTTTFGDGFDSDDWNLDGYLVSTGDGGIVFAQRWSTPGTYLFRFSGDQHQQRFTIPVDR